jgi:Fe2+ or Zn2+ uptake regulation protein
VNLGDVRDVFFADQRLVILRCLKSAPGYTANDSILDDVLSRFSHNISRDLVRSHVHWLEEQGLVNVESMGITLNAKLTQRGLDVAKGEAYVEGVKTPSPGA